MRRMYVCMWYMARTLVGVVEEGDALEEAQPLDVHRVEVDEEVRQHQEVDHHDGRDEDAGPVCWCGVVRWWWSVAASVHIYT